MNEYFDQKHRLNYGALLHPDNGYKLSFAVGCTYSLDFEALVSVPLCLGTLEQSGSEDMKNPFILLESIRKSSDSIAIFCNCDGIRMLRNIQPVHALLENSVFPVNLGNGSNFHPKIWIIKYESSNDEPDIIKVLVLSRNLTFDRSLDLVVEMKGLVKGKIKRHSKQQPLVDLLDFLESKCDLGNKKEKIKELENDLLRVETFEINDDFDDYGFFITGIPNHENDAKEICSPCNKILIVSPFLAKTVVSDMVRNCSTPGKNQTVNRVLISRITSITPSIFDLFDEVYVPTEGLEDNTILEEVDNEPKRDLHAKVIFKDTYTENSLYIGSFNTTSNARDRNVEIMLKLRFKPYKSSLNAIKDQFVNGTYPVFQRLLSKTTLSEEVEDGEEMTDFSDVIDSVEDATIKKDVNGSYSTVLHFKNDNPNVFISPLFLESNPVFKAALSEVIFDHMTTKELSELFIAKKDDEVRIIKINITDFPIDDRNDAIVKSILDSRPKILQYILFLLSDNIELSSLELKQLIKEGTSKDGTGKEYEIIPSIYEKMLLASVRDPGKIKSIKEIITSVGEEKIGEDFFDLVNCFESFIGE